jgi:CRP/FNR family cyclic AMP-dependent transcriptional regulator
MIDTRFERRKEILEGLKSARIVQGKGKIANDLLKAGRLEKHKKGHQLLVKGAFDRDVFFVLAGSLAADINGHRQNCREAGETIGELSTLSPDSRRSADVFVDDDTVLWRVPAGKFKEISFKHPEMLWRLGKSIADRLGQRNRHYASQSSRPVVFIISSSEQLPIVNALSAALSEDAQVVPWNVSFWPSAYPLEALQDWVERSDFAIAIATLDDVINTRRTEHGIVRDNVLFEIGLFMARLGRPRTLILVEKDKFPLTSDLKGVTTLVYEVDDSGIETKSVKLDAPLAKIKDVISQLGVLPKLVL